ncbi:MAG: hypothetical protein JNM18_04135 [Planctomycetaceae bacterium]|nr:hypothetical protein [Planctomycetaceae bacterium]
MAAHDDSPDIRPRHLRSRLDIDGDQLTLDFGSGGLWGVGCFLAFWLCGWTVGCVVLLYKVITEPRVEYLFFGTPFWASWFAVAGFLLYMLFHRERLLLNADGLRKESRLLGFGRWQQIALHEVLGFHERYKSDNEGTTTRWIEVQTRGRPLKIAESLAESERHWIIGRLRRHLDELRQRYASSRPAWLVERDQVPTVNDKFREAHTLPPGIEPPSDNAWYRTDEFDAILLTNHGHWSWTSVFLLLFLNLFWNGIVSLFVGKGLGLFPEGGDFGNQGVEVMLLLFMIPFVVIGLLMMAGLLFCLLEPGRLSRWSIGRNEVQFQLTWFGIGPRRSFAILPGSRLVIERLDDAASGAFKLRSWIYVYHLGQNELPVRYRLVIAGADATETCAIEALSLGEAEWLASLIYHERGEWFR